MNAKEAITTLMENGWSKEEAVEELKEDIEEPILPLEKCVEMAISIRRAMTPDDGRGFIVG